jgi:hypothetical protein
VFALLLMIKACQQLIHSVLKATINHMHVSALIKSLISEPAALISSSRRSCNIKI